MTKKEKKLSFLDACSQWLEVKDNLTRLEEKRQELEAVMKPGLDGQEPILVDGWEIALSWTKDKESLRWAEAKKTLTAFVLEKLEPFVSKSTYNTIRRTFKGGKK